MNKKVLIALYGFYNTWKLGFEKRFLLAYAAVSFVGMGSWCFHMTLLYEFQLLDELPSTCIIYLFLLDPVCLSFY
jgi:dihydroceramidase